MGTEEQYCFKSKIIELITPLPVDDQLRVLKSLDFLDYEIIDEKDFNKLIDSLNFFRLANSNNYITTSELLPLQKIYSNLLELLDKYSSLLSDEDFIDSITSIVTYGHHKALVSKEPLISEFIHPPKIIDQFDYSTEILGKDSLNLNVSSISRNIGYGDTNKCKYDKFINKRLLLLDDIYNIYKEEYFSFYHTKLIKFLYTNSKNSRDKILHYLAIIFRSISRNCSRSGIILSQQEWFELFQIEPNKVTKRQQELKQSKILSETDQFELLFDNICEYIVNNIHQFLIDENVQTEISFVQLYHIIQSILQLIYPSFKHNNNRKYILLYILLEFFSSLFQTDNKDLIGYIKTTQDLSDSVIQSIKNYMCTFDDAEISIHSRKIAFKNIIFLIQYFISKYFDKSASDLEEIRELQDENTSMTMVIILLLPYLYQYDSIIENMLTLYFNGLNKPREQLENSADNAILQSNVLVDDLLNRNLKLTDIIHNFDYISSSTMFHDILDIITILHTVMKIMSSNSPEKSKIDLLTVKLLMGEIK